MCHLSGLIFSDYELNQQHVTDRAPGDGKQHLLFPEMQPHGDRNGDGLRQPVAVLQGLHAAQAVNHQHGENRPRQHPAQILHIFRRGPVGTEQQKGQKTGEHGAQHAYADGDELLRQRH